ncbi:hypothetical protein CYMTET_12791 [Cymbomonas tetramitiformis]|uniref:Uncharacterized protein n=1 Tax=Cymbomonas tetramitiformis TaxID=36881 RepID=A0AAE0LC34_9CHLO|nr:hypothetical protein CYMTET_12791 [Cymbomonas tetramitiformis]
MLKKVEELCGILPLLNKLGHAQAQGLLLRFCAHPRLGFWLRGVPPEMMREAAEEHDRRMQGALRDLLPGGGLAWHSCEFATLPHGMGLTKAARVSSAAWLGGFAQVWEDMRELFPTVTAGTEDLGAESDLPYVNSLQAAMQKVSEAMEVIGEARGANEHLPPQVPKADDVKKLSDYSRSQKRAQRVYAAVLHSVDWLWLAGHVGASRLPWLFSVTFNSIGPAFLRGVPCCPALELSCFGGIPGGPAANSSCGAAPPWPSGGVPRLWRRAGSHRDTLTGMPGGVGTGGGNWYSFIHHKLQRVLFEVAKSAYPLASALHDDFAGYLTYSRNHCPDVTVLNAEGPGQHVLFDVATARPMSDAHLGAAMMAPGAAAKKVEESKVATYGDVRPHHFIPFGVEVYGGLGPAAYGFLRKTQRRFRERRYMEANAEGGEQVDGNGDEDEDEDEEAARGGAVGWKEKWVRLLSFALARGVTGLIIRRAVGRCPAGSGWRWAGGGRVGGGMGPDLDRGEADRREGAERLALMDRAWEDAFEETDYATQDGSGGGMQESEGTQREQSGQAPGETGEAGAMASRLLESMEDVRREVEHLGTVEGQEGGTAEARSGGARAGIGGLSQAASSVEDILNEWDDLLSPGPGSGVWTQEQSGASPEQAMALAEGGVATLMGASRRVAGLLGGVDGMGGTDEDDGGDVGRRKSVADAQVWMRATQFIILSPLGQRLGILAVPWRHSSSAPAGQPQRGSGGPVRLREQRGGLARGLGGGDMARADRGAGMDRLQAQGGSALVVQMQRGSGGSARLRGSHSSLVEARLTDEAQVMLGLPSAHQPSCGHTGVARPPHRDAPRPLLSCMLFGVDTLLRAAVFPNVDSYSRYLGLFSVAATLTVAASGVAGAAAYRSGAVSSSGMLATAAAGACLTMGYIAGVTTTIRRFDF